MALVLVLVAAVGAVAFFALGGDDSDGPADTVRAFLAAEADRDCTTAMDLVTPAALQQGYGTRDRAEALENCRDFVENEEAQGVVRDRTIHELQVSEEEDGEATVALEATDEITDGTQERSETYSQDIMLVEEDGDWLVDRIGPPAPDGTG